jgi:hypothetical protein
MPQDRLTGAAANRWGRETAKKVAIALGVAPPQGNSNECFLHGERVVNNVQDIVHRNNGQDIVHTRSLKIE